MNGRPHSLLALAIAAAILHVAPVLGQEAPAAAPGQPVESRAARPGGRGARLGRPPIPPNPDVMTARQVEQYFEDVVLYQAQTQLGLSDDQFLRFGAGLARLQTARRQQQARRMMMLRDLNQLLTATPLDETAVTAKIKEFDDSSTEYGRQVQEAYGAIDRVLDVRQRARFRIFEENVERRKLELLARARQAGARPAAGPPAR